MNVSEDGKKGNLFIRLNIGCGWKSFCSRWNKKAGRKLLTKTRRCGLARETVNTANIYYTMLIAEYFMVENTILNYMVLS